MAKYKRKSRFTSILCGILVVATLIGACAGIAAIAKRDTKTISSTVFSVGAVDEDGNYIPKSNKSIYTKELIECQGLIIEPDFEATGTYQVFYYDSEKQFLGATETMSASGSAYSKGDTEPFAKYCRIMITPEVPVDDNGVAEEDFKIHFYEVFGIARDYKITVLKNQNAWEKTEFEHSSRTTGKRYGLNEDTGMIREDSADMTVTVFTRFDVSNYSELALLTEVTGGAGNGHIFFTDEEGLILDDVNYTLGDGKLVEENTLLFDSIEIPKDSVYCYIVGCTGMSMTYVYGR